MAEKTTPLDEMAAAWDEGAEEALAQRDDAHQMIRNVVTSLRNRVEPATIIARLNRYLADQGEQS